MLLAAAAGLYAAFAVDVFQDEAPKLATRRLRIELDEFLLVSAAVVAILLALTLNQHRAQAREHALRIAAEHRVVDLAYRDTLTGIANRRAFDETLAALVAAPAPAGKLNALLLLDLNGFKQVNDAHGHGEGDALLRIVARRLVGAVRTQDSPARIGGDEFAIVTPAVENAAVLIAVAGRVAASLGRPIEINGNTHRVGTGIGIAIAAPGMTAEELMRRADVALYAAKRGAGSAWRFYEPTLEG